ncbi:uncharacterized protein VTP21DRAFT_4870 [Calcarisporiella thermophila]|uniref:uncharacterized protein n=1 Tax=Calcarisporiella thermophila TaxID=911321 RepID=UPI0037427AFB
MPSRPSSRIYPVYTIESVCPQPTPSTPSTSSTSPASPLSRLFNTLLFPLTYFIPPPSMSSLPVVLITGASQGLGRAIACAVVKKNANVVAIARTRAKLEDLRNELGDRCEIIVGDVTEESTISQAVECAKTKWGRLDAVVANAGVLQIEPVASLSQAEWKRAFDVNFFSIIALVQRALPLLRVAPSKGRFIAISSGASTKAYSGWSSYCASKAALNMFVASLGMEEPDLISMAIRPGVLDTEMQSLVREQGAANMKPEEHQKFINLHAQNQLVDAREPGHVIAALALDAPKAFSGGYFNWEDEAFKEYQRRA